MKKGVLLLKKLTKGKSENGGLNQFFLQICSGEIVNLIGLEESGKNEIYAILFGEDTADSGDVWFDGRRYEKGKGLPVEQANGIFFIGNNELIIPELSVSENMYIIEKMNYFQLSVSKKKMEQQAKKILDKFDVRIDPGKKAKRLNRCECYILRLMRAYVKRAKLIVVDDILDDCSYDEIRQIIEILSRFKKEGISIFWMNSYPDAITEVADRTVVIRDGRNSYMFYKNEYDKKRIIKTLIKNENTETEKRKKTLLGETVFRAEKITNEYFDELSFSCRKGEIIGIYDLQNKFSRELRRLLLGRQNYSGNLYVDEKKYIADAEYKLAKNKLGVIDGTKYQALIFEELSAQENIGVAAYEKMTRWGCFINKRVKKYLIHKGSEICESADINKAMVNISRGDAVKIIFNRWKLINPKILFCFQPFLRLDVISRNQLENILLEFQQRGTGIVLSSAKISELLPICDRILVIERNHVIKEVDRGQFDKTFQ